jgi:O-antigen ligase
VHTPALAGASRGAAIAAGAAGLAVGWAVLFGGASDDGRLFWVGATATLLAAALGTAALAGALPLPRLDRSGLTFVAALAGLVAWTGASLGWSMVADHSWRYLDRGVAYLAFAVLGLFAGALVPRASRTVAAGLTMLLAVATVWALAGKAVPGWFPDLRRVPRLRDPVGYWNALALLLAAALPLALSHVTERGGRLRTALATALFFGSTVALLLTFSRAGTAVAAIVVAVYLAWVRPRLPALLVVVTAVPPAIVVAVLAATGPDLDGAPFVLALLAGAAVAVAAADVLRRRASPGWERRVLVGLGCAAVVAAVALGVRAGGPSGWWREFTNPEQPGQGAGRVESLSSSNRWTWWRESWTLWEDRPLLGQGADTFETARRPIRKSALSVTEPHSTPLQFLAELGLVGFGLLAAATVAAALAIRRGVREARDRPAAFALALLPLAYALHALVDYDWDFVAVTGPALFVVGVLAARGLLTWPRGRHPFAAAAVAVVVLAALYSLWAPWQADRLVYRSELLADADPAAAARKARSAHRLNPLSPEPYWAWAEAAFVAGDDATAVRRYTNAVELQPENWETWYRLGLFEFDTGRFTRACYALDRAYGLDPQGPAGTPGGELDRVKKRLPGCPGPPPSP